MSLADFPSHLLFRLGYMPMHKPVKARGCVYHDSLRPLKTLAWITWVVIGAGEMTDMWTKLECYLHAKMGECQWDVHNKMWHIRIPKTKIKNPLCRLLKISACVKFQPWKLYSLTTCIHFVLHRNLVRSDPHPEKLAVWHDRSSGDRGFIRGKQWPPGIGSRDVDPWRRAGPSKGVTNGVCVCDPEGDRVAENMMAAHSEKHRVDTVCQLF